MAVFLILKCWLLLICNANRVIEKSTTTLTVDCIAVLYSFAMRAVDGERYGNRIAVSYVPIVYKFRCHGLLLSKQVKLYKVMFPSRCFCIGAVYPATQSSSLKEQGPLYAGFST
jgi:hypothetical protein